MDIDLLVKRIVDGALRHGTESEQPEHALGDLEEALRLALPLMPSYYIEMYANLPEMRTIINGGIPDEFYDFQDE